jgi:hypothetical protein
MRRPNPLITASLVGVVTAGQRWIDETEGSGS